VDKNKLKIVIGVMKATDRSRISIVFADAASQTATALTLKKPSTTATTL
jgi:hypothetical protein